MKRSIRISTALSAAAAAAVVTGCASGQHRTASQSLSAADASKIGLATRALFALDQNDFATAVAFAEQAVEHTPGEASFRTLLGNAYFASGRFASAEAAYRDSLSLDSAQPKVVLKLALAQIAQGRNGEALALLESGRGTLEASDYGLAIALAGQPADAVAVLGQAARRPDADARVRQNLALAYGLTGDWEKARTIAAQDISPDQVDGRVQQWMAIAQPKRASDQVAALTGVTPVADPGQPVRLALNPRAKPAQQYAEAAPQPLPTPSAPIAVAPVAYAEAIPAAVPQLPPLPPLPVTPAADPAPQPEPQAVEQVAQALMPTAPEPLAPLPTKFEEQKPIAAKVAVTQRHRRAAVTRAGGRSNSVVQLGAYGSPQRVAAAWEQLSRRYPSLNRYRPVSARFDSSKGVVYRLAVKGFGSHGEAQNVCEALQSKGKTCFVRRVAGDAPVRLASR